MSKFHRSISGRNIPNVRIRGLTADEDSWFDEEAPDTAGWSGVPEGGDCLSPPLICRRRLVSMNVSGMLEVHVFTGARVGTETEFIGLYRKHRGSCREQCGWSRRLGVFETYKSPKPDMNSRSLIPRLEILIWLHQWRFVNFTRKLRAHVSIWIKETKRECFLRGHWITRSSDVSPKAGLTRL